MIVVVSTSGAPEETDRTPVGIIRPIPVDGDRLDRGVDGGRRRRNVRRALWAGVLVVVVVLGFYLVSLYQVWSTGRDRAGASCRRDRRDGSRAVRR